MYTKQELHDIFYHAFEENGGKNITIEKLCKQLGTCQRTLHKNILAVDAYEDCPDVFMHIKRPIHVFDSVVEESAYWIGYLVADGCIAASSSGKTSDRLMLECKAEDAEILEKFCDFVGIRKSRITKGHGGASVALNMTTKVFTTDLSQYGLVKNKSRCDIHIPEVIKSDSSLLFQYLRGIVDGDGTIHDAERSVGVSFVSTSYSLVTEMKEELEKYLPYPDSIWLMTRDPEKKPGATQNLYQLKIGTGPARENMHFLYDKFYTGQKVILSRKE